MMTHVSWELRSGVSSLRSLLELLEEAAASVVASSRIEKSPAWEWIGYYLESQEFFVGVYYDDPDTVVFETQKLSIPENAASNAGFGEMGTTSKSPTGNKWICKLDLASEDVHFFALSPPSQLNRIKQFLTRCLDKGRELGGKGGRGCP